MTVQAKKTKTAIATFLLAGNCIGAGTLAIPITTGIAGFFPAIFSTLLIWLFSMATGLLFLEAILANPDGSNMISISRRLIGRYGMILTGTSFFLMYYLILTIFFSWGVPIFTSLSEQLTGIAIAPWMGHGLFVIFFGGVVYFGINVAGKLNFLFFTGLIITALILIFSSYPYIIADHLKRQNWLYVSFAIPTLFSALSYQNLLPSLSTYLHRNHRKLRLTVIVGTTLPFLLYAIWQWMMIGTLSEGTFWAAYEMGAPTLQAAKLITLTPWLNRVGDFFTLFAFITSLLATGIAMVDFWGDGLKISAPNRVGLKRFILCLLVFIPPLLFAQLYTQFSFDLFGFVDGFLHTIFIGFLPIWMVWLVRYHHRLPVPHLLPGGKPVLIALLVIAFYIIYFQGIELIH